MDELSVEILSAVREIRDLIRLMAEPAIAERDKRLRNELRRIVGNSVPKARSVLLMDGSRTQSVIQRETAMQASNLSTLVKQLKVSNLLTGEAKEPKLTISVPANFFENGASDE